MSGLILSLSVTPGGEHDSTCLLPLLLRAKASHEHIQEVLADAAYGGMRTRTEVIEAAGVKVTAPPVKSGRAEGLGKADFAIDFDKRLRQATSTNSLPPKVRG